MSKDQFFEEVLHKYLSNKNEREEFKQELHLTICENPKTLEYWNKGVFKWIYLTIIKRSICSSNSRYHYKYRKKPYSLYDDLEHFQPEDIIDEDDFDYEEEEKKTKQKLDIIQNIITQQIELNPILKRDFTLFNMYYRGNMTYRKVSEITKISLMGVHIYIKNARMIILNEIEKNKTN